MHKFFAVLFLTLGGAAGIGGAVVIRDHPWVKVDPSQVTTAAPEIDPAGAASALALLVGGLAALRGRREKK